MSREDLERAQRLQEMGIEIRSVELREEASALDAFVGSGGNRQMRRAAQRAAKGKGTVNRKRTRRN